MKFTLNWLKEYLQTDASLDQICQKLTAIGLEVENVNNQAQALSYFTVAKIIEAKNHENSNKLKICQVEVKKNDGLQETLQIICGAANARSGIKVCYAPIGAVIPVNQMVIKKAKIAGVESNGMLCSASELGLNDDSDGIIEIDEKWPIGAKISEVLQKNDALIEINVTPNRGDCLGVYGIARDLAASGIGQLKKITFEQNKSEFAFPLAINNNANQACNLAAFRMIKNVKNCESPSWLKEKLAAINVNSISAIVDITNYIMFSFNRPMHAYDALKINGGINIRFALDDEKFTSLKGDEYKINSQILTIADDEKILGLAGITGSNNSGCDIQTNQIILEAAFFDPVTIASAGRHLNILSDARFRFERGVDENTCTSAIEMATKLILEICGGNPSEIKVVGQAKPLKKINFDLNKIEKITGIKISSEKIEEILQHLEFKITKESSQNFLVEIPSHRHDISAEHDLVEEVVRIYGYDKILSQAIQNCNLKLNNDILNKVRSSLIAKGMIENINWSFCDHNLLNLFAEVNQYLMLSNPISAELDHMRPNLIIGLLESYKKNYLRNFTNISSFEIGKIFLYENERRSEKLMIAGLRAGKNKEQDHYNDQRDFDVFDAKKDFIDVIEIYGLRFNSLQISNDGLPKYYHPFKSAVLKLGKNIIGYFGEVHPKIAKKYDLKTALNIFEIFAENLPASQKLTKKSFVINDLQALSRDFAFLMDDEKAIGDLIKTIENCDKQLIKQVDIFDIYRGKNIEENKKSIALRVTIQPVEKSLTSEEIDALSQKIISESEKQGAKLRV